MLAQRPDITCAGDRFGGRFRNGIGRVVGNRGAIFGIGQESVQFILGDPNKSEVEAFGQQRLQFLQEQGLVPLAKLGQIVVGDAVGPAFSLVEVAEPDPA